MAYNVAANMQFAKPVSAFIDARDNVTRNALAERQVANVEQNTAFQQQRLSATDQIAAEQRAKAAEQEDSVKLHTAMQYLANVSNDPVKFQSTAQAMLRHPEIGRILGSNGVTIEDVTPQSVQELLAATGAQAGQGPAPAPITYTTSRGPRGALLQTDSTGKTTQVVGPDNTQPAAGGQSGYRLLSPEETVSKGFPPGTVVQVGPDGKMDVITKRDNTGALSQKDQTTAKMKMNTVALARSQLQKIKEAFDEGRKGIGPNAFGGAQGLLPTQAGKMFDARVNQMRSTLTALTRVPGVGAMSDYETKLDQSKFPSRTAYESVTADTLQNLDDQLSLIENGYRELLTGAQTAAPAQAPASGGWSVQEVK